MKLLILCLLFILTSPSFAKKESTKDIMQQAFYSLTQLLPYTSSGMKFSDPKHEKHIQEHLIRMTEAFKKGNHQNMLNAASFKPNIEAIVTNLEAAQINFSEGSKNFARLRINSSTSLCISCHSQLPKDKMISKLSTSKDLINQLQKNPYELANLYLILRKYESALNFYSLYIKQESPKKTDKAQLAPHFFNKYIYNSYFNIIYITAKIFGSPKQTLENLERLTTTHYLPQYVKSDLQMWQHRAQYWNKMYPQLDKQKLTKKQIKKMIKEVEKRIIIADHIILSSDYDYDLMLLSGILSRTLMTSAIKIDKSEALYWLGLAEYRLGKSLFYNIGDRYLTECIESRPKSKIAKKCFQALSAEVDFRNTGTSGTHIPKTIQLKLKKLKKLL